ncbi:Membrane-bound lytic murein transglycosylase D precursor [Oligella urethralis]|uniref:lytic transglycosylase n=1 Tax=Oligella urethralis TaxID=90245 RepID=UPI000DFF4202|nr:transglycosylase SLT domain-containing protein [Oligella urethralis]SUA62301.1 Membrane-bound lytic murein transglycosylase D precursor [Oligella urethralis]
MRLLVYALLATTAIISGCSSTGGNLKSNTAATSKHYNNVWDRIRAGYAMPDLRDSRVDYWVNYYTKRPGSVQTMANRSAKYIYYVTTELQKRGMPTELALLPFVESAYNTTALSRVKASGLWQFMPATGTDFNLTQNWWRDDRRDPVSSTQAAINYLAYLYNFQGNDWHLALASYNWGQGSVKRARDRNAAQGRGTDYLSLNMPQETRDYVPKLMAFKRIISQPAKYGITLPHVPDQPYFEEVNKTVDIDIEVAAKLAGMSLSEFKEMNPQFHRPVILAEHGQRILIPKANVASYKKNLANYKGNLASYSGYTPRSGEALADIAQRLGVDLALLKQLNGYTAKQTVAINSRTLMVPRGSGISPSASPSGIRATPPAPVQQPMPAASAGPDMMLALIERTRLPASAVNPPPAATPALAQQRVPAPAPAARPASTTPRAASAALVASNTSPAPASSTVDPLADLIRADGSTATAVPALAANRPQTAAPSSAASVASTAALSEQPAAMLPNVGGNQSLAARAASTVQRSGPVVQRVSWDSEPTTSAARVRTAAYQPPAVPAAPTATRNPASHRVAKGETLYSLARQYHTTVNDLAALNNITVDGLKAGMVLRLPNSGVEG